MNSEHVDLEYKILVVGETEVGKTSTIFRYVDNTFNDDGGVPTVGIDVKNKYVTIDNKKIRVLLWDTAGQERFQSLTKNFFKGAHGILLLYDLTRKDTFIKLRKWITEIHNLANNPKLVVAGNKSDKINNREVTEQSLKDFGEKIGAETFESSAKTGDGVNEIFSCLINKLYEDKSIGQVTNEEDDEEVISQKKRGYTLSSKGSKNKKKKKNCKC